MRRSWTKSTSVTCRIVSARSVRRAAMRLSVSTSKTMLGFGVVDEPMVTLFVRVAVVGLPWRYQRLGSPPSPGLCRNLFAQRHDIVGRIDDALDKSGQRFEGVLLLVAIRMAIVRAADAADDM